jgi:hypothetical protein
MNRQAPNRRMGGQRITSLNQQSQPYLTIATGTVIDDLTPAKALCRDCRARKTEERRLMGLVGWPRTRERIRRQANDGHKKHEGRRTRRERDEQTGDKCKNGKGRKENNRAVLRRVYERQEVFNKISIEPFTRETCFWQRCFAKPACSQSSACLGTLLGIDSRYLRASSGLAGTSAGWRAWYLGLALSWRCQIPYLRGAWISMMHVLHRAQVLQTSEEFDNSVSFPTWSYDYTHRYLYTVTIPSPRTEIPRRRRHTLTRKYIYPLPYRTWSQLVIKA